jgi:hypothetical protein
VTEYLPGEEIVAYTLGDPDGDPLLCVTKTMGRWRGGASQLGAMRDEPAVRDLANAIAKKLKLVGPWFAQFKQDRHGSYKLMEINARLGGGSGICRLAGVNLPLLTVQMLAGRTVSVPGSTHTLSWVRNLRAFPTMAPFDRIVWSLSALSRPSDGKLRPRAIATLFELANQSTVQDCYGTGVPDALAEWNLHRHFGHRHETLEAALRSVAGASRTVFVTDDPTEQREIAEARPEIRVVSGTSLEVLGMEKL